ncbi:MAG: oligosaccharide flippase family protein [Candidatus Lokiarchaeota archaeon]
MLNEGNQKLFSNVNILISGYFISTILSAISTIFIINFLSVDSYALMNIALILPTIFILIGDFGLNSATTHFIASKKITNPKEVRNIAKINIYIKIFIGFLYSLVLIINAGGIAKYIYNINNSNMILLIWFGSIGVFSTLLFDSVNYAFIGLENMSAMRYSTISRKIIEAAVSIGLLLIGFGAIGPLIGLFLGPLIASLFGLIYLKRKLNTFYSSGMGLDWSFLLKMIKYGYPLSFVTLIVGIQPQIFTFLLIQLGNIKFVSFFNVAYASKKIIFILTQSISFTFFPAFSRFNWEKIDDRNKLKSKYQFSIKIGSFLILPITLLLIIFSREIFPIIFGSKYIEKKIWKRFIPKY